MLIIKKQKRTGAFAVEHLSKNGRGYLIGTFTQKPSAWISIKSTVKSYGKKAEIIVQDHSLTDPTDPAVYKVVGSGKIISSPKGIKPKKIRTL